MTRPFIGELALLVRFCLCARGASTSVSRRWLVLGAGAPQPGCALALELADAGHVLEGLALLDLPEDLGRAALAHGVQPC